jgi:peptidoglycan/xylan/chitin deacetylase (PgdA/CDA1 family)
MAFARAMERVLSTRAVDVTVASLERLHRSDTHTLPVLTYHRVDHPDATPHLYPRLVSATPSGFARQVEEVARRWTPVSADDVLAWRRGGSLPHRAVLFTFDDAYEDFATHAWPVLRRHGVPALLFVPTGFPDSGRSFWWDDVHDALRTMTGTVTSPAGTFELTDDGARAAAFRALRAWFKSTPHDEAAGELDQFFAEHGYTPRPAPVLGWDHLRRLRDDGVTLAPHSVSHAMLDRLPADEALAEVSRSRADLRERTGSDVPVFAYPSGQHDAIVVEAAREAGIEIAFTTHRRVNRGTPDWLRMARVNVSHRYPSAVVRAQLLPAVAAVVGRVA